MPDPMDAVLPAPGTDDSGFCYVNAADPLPTVACFLVLSDPARVPFARAAVNQFVAQTYPRKRLIIANASGRPVTNVAHAEIEEFVAQPGTIGSLRNQTLDRIKDGGWFLRPFWDDDDCYPPEQLAYQMLFRDTNSAVLLTHQAIVLDVPKTEAAVYMRHRPWGIDNTALLPRWRCNHRFDEMLSWGEDADYVRHFRQQNRVSVIDNSAAPASCVSVAIYHGRNAAPRDAFVGDRDPMVKKGSLLVPPAELALINQALIPHRAKFARA